MIQVNLILPTRKTKTVIIFCDDHRLTRGRLMGEGSGHSFKNSGLESLWKTPWLAAPITESETLWALALWETTVLGLNVTKTTYAWTIDWAVNRVDWIHDPARVRITLTIHEGKVWGLSALAIYSSDRTAIGRVSNS